jgi:hypothetical protein
MIKRGEFDGLYCHMIERGQSLRGLQTQSREQITALLIHFRGDRKRHWRNRIDMSNSTGLGVQWLLPESLALPLP